MVFFLLFKKHFNFRLKSSVNNKELSILYYHLTKELSLLNSFIKKAKHNKLIIYFLI